MSRAIGRIAGIVAIIAVLVWSLLAIFGPGNLPPGVSQAGDRVACPECGRKARRHGDTDLFVCPKCGACFGVGVCAECGSVARTDQAYTWICGSGHTTDDTRKCPCTWLGEPVGDGWWWCGRKSCARFAVTDCQCVFFGGAYHGYASINEDGALWFCELTGGQWPGA